MIGEIKSMACTKMILNYKVITGGGKARANEMNFSMSYAPGTGSIVHIVKV